MKKYYLYGAGINCSGVIKFYGTERIAGVIDGDEKKQGKKIEGLDIISLETYLKEGKNAPIIITAFFQKEAIKKILQEKGITNFYSSPYMQTGYYENFNDIIYKLDLLQYRKIYFVDKTLLSEMIEEEVKKKTNKIEIIYLDVDTAEHMLENESVIIITADEEKAKAYSYNKISVIDINEIYKEQFAFRNSELLQFKDIHKGKRCFIIGNGPSLKYEDLERLYKNEEVCFGANRIYYAYEHTNWRPTYYVLVDHILYEKEKENLKGMNEIKFVRHFYKTPKIKNSKNIYEVGGLHYNPGNPQISFDIEQGVYIGNTVVYDALQIAVYMGFKEIYFLGVDMTSNKRPEEEDFHFYKSRDNKERLNKGNVNEATLAIKYAGECLKERGILLKNATRGGELEVLERVDLDTLFEGEIE